MNDVITELNKKDCNVVLDGNFYHVMNRVSEAYTGAESWQARREILSIVATELPLRLLQLFIPGLTEYRFSAARLYAKAYGAGAKIEETPKMLQKFENRQISHFIDFIISPHVCTDIPFGQKVLKLSSGTELFVPNTIRNMTPNRIIDQYHLYCKEMCLDFHPLSRSSLLLILKNCKASTRKSLQGINYFAASASEGFEWIVKAVKDNFSYLDDSSLLIDSIKRARLYLKSDYKVHISRSSTVADHCCVYALNDSNNNHFTQQCDHEHDESCIECQNIRSTLDRIENIIKESENDEKISNRILKRFLVHRESIELWNSHLLRSVNQDLCRERMLDNLSDDEVFLNLDWAMKFIPIKSREPQSDFFGKQGISWHITVAMINSTSFSIGPDCMDVDNSVSEDSNSFIECETIGSTNSRSCNNTISHEAQQKTYKYKVFVHIFDECTQDSYTVLAILSDVLSRINISDPQIKKAFLRSDNAGCYHSANTLVLSKQISEKTGIKIKRFDFCDPQGGKGPCDRYAAVIKSHVRRYLNENNNVTNAAEFVKACHSYKGVRGVVALDCEIKGKTSKKKSKCVIKQIMNYFNFESTDDGLLAHRSWNIGSGILIPWSQFSVDYSIHDISSKGKENYTHDWTQTSAKPQKDELVAYGYGKNEDESLLLDSRSKQLYECNVEEGCTAAFVKYQNLINHIIIGKHIRSVEKISLIDTAMTMYHSRLEVGNRRVISVDLTLTQKCDEDSSMPSEGWALPKHRPHKDFSKKQHQYLQKKFDEGIVGVKHCKPKEIVWDMENMKSNDIFYFSADEILKENQIRSCFARLKRERQLAASQSSLITEKLDDNIIDDIDNKEVESDIDLIDEDLGDKEVNFEEIEISEKLFIGAKQALESNVNELE